MSRLPILAFMLALLAAPAQAAAPDPERALDTPVGSSAGSPYVGSDAKAMFNAIGKAGGRITTVEVEMVKDKPRYAIGFVGNRGVQARRWWWDPQLSEGQLLAKLKSRNARLIDLDVFVVKGKRRLSAVSVENAGESGKAWWWHPRVKRGDLLKLTEQHGSRIVDLERGPKGLYDIVTIKNEGVDARAWWLLFGLNHYQIRSEALKLKARPQDIEYTGSANDFDVVLVQEERPEGWFFNTRETAVEALRHNRSFGARTAIVDYYRWTDGKRYLAHVGVTDVDPATEAVRSKLLSDSGEFTPNGTMGLLTSALGNATPLVALNPALPHETASSGKALYHAAITRIYEQKNLPIDKAGDFSYRQYIGVPSCPTDNIMSKPVVQRSLAGAAADMLRPSDNGATAAILARIGGKAALRSFALSLGLTGVRIGSVLGCWDREDPNLWTLNDAGRLWANIVSNRVATKEPYLTHLLTTPTDGSTSKRNAWRAAANAAGRPDLANLDAQVEFRSKAGGYGGGAGSVATEAGVLWVPVHTPGGTVRRPYVVGTFYDTDKSSIPSTYTNVTTELAKPAIAEALATFPPPPG